MTDLCERLSTFPFPLIHAYSRLVFLSSKMIAQIYEDTAEGGGATRA